MTELMPRKYRMNIKPIKTRKDYQEALKNIEKIFDAKPNTLKGDKLEVLVTLVEAYEKKHFNIYPPDPIEAIKFRMEQLGLKQSDIAEVIGGKNRTSEILNRKRELTAKMMRDLHNKFNIPAESLLA
jgi:HTH-type transcriptional regulator/antitoxin HigA